MFKLRKQICTLQDDMNDLQNRINNLETPILKNEDVNSGVNRHLVSNNLTLTPGFEAEENYNIYINKLFSYIKTHDKNIIVPSQLIISAVIIIFLDLITFTELKPFFWGHPNWFLLFLFLITVIFGTLCLLFFKYNIPTKINFFNKKTLENIIIEDSNELKIDLNLLQSYLQMKVDNGQRHLNNISKNLESTFLSASLLVLALQHLDDGSTLIALLLLLLFIIVLRYLSLLSKNNEDFIRIGLIIKHYCYPGIYKAEVIQRHLFTEGESNQFVDHSDNNTVQKLQRTLQISHDHGQKYTNLYQLGNNNKFSTFEITLLDNYNKQEKKLEKAMKDIESFNQAKNKTS